jgi:flagellar hook-length control protein FliK
MNSVGIDTHLKTAQVSSKTKPAAQSEDNGQFHDYLREAANSQQQPVKEQPNVKAKSNDSPIQAANKDQDSTKSSEEQTNPTSEAVEQIDEPTSESEVDEVLLSAAAIAASTEAVTVTEPVEVAVEPTVETAVGETEQPLQGQEPAATQDFLPDLEQAISTDASFESETVAPTIIDANGEAPPESEGVAKAAEHAVVLEPVVAQATAQQSGELQTTSDSSAELDGDTEKPDTAEHKTPKSAAVGKQSVAEQLMVPVVSVVAVTDTVQETKQQASSENGSPVPVTQVTSTVQQQSQTTDAGQTDASAVNSDQDSRMPTIDRARLVQRVANAFRSAQQNDGHIQMRLSPPELGSLRIEIAVRHGVLSANLETETADARRVLLDNLPALRQRLAEQDIRIEKFDVDVRREGSQSEGQAGAQDRQAQQQSQRATAQNRIRTTTQTEVVSTRLPRLHVTSADSGLDVRI